MSQVLRAVLSAVYLALFAAYVEVGMLFNENYGFLASNYPNPMLKLISFFFAAYSLASLYWVYIPKRTYALRSLYLLIAILVFLFGITVIG